MDISSPLRSLVPSLDSAVLAVLAETESGLGVTQISRLSGRGSRPGHQLVLDRLVEHGLVLADPTNKGFTYRLNRKHLLAPAIMVAVNARRELLRRLGTAVGDMNPKPIHASVFGSFARREGTEHSDIDLFLVMPDDSESGWDEALRTLEDLVLGWTGNRLETLIFSPRHLSTVVAAGEPVIDSLRDEALTLHGPEVEDLLSGSKRRGKTPVAR